MFVILPLLTFLAGHLVLGAPTLQEVAEHELAKRDVCDGVNATPVLYTEYGTDACPPALVLNDDGSCPGQDPSANGCVAYCQIRTEFQYVTEVPIQDSYCYGPMTCSYAETFTTTVTVNYGLDASWTSGFNFGISGGYSIANSVATAFTNAVTLGANQCGYFTVIPIWKYVCGSVTASDIVAGGTYYCAANPTTYGNICVSGPRYVNGKPIGDGNDAAASVTVFVYTDCVTQQPLGPESQNPAYNQPGVPMDRGLYATMAENWAYIQPGNTVPAPSTPQCGTYGYTMPVADVQTCNTYLDAADSEQCCSGGSNGSANICSLNGNAVDLAGQDSNGNPLCLDCARIANYVAGLETNCVQNGLVGGTQDVVEVPGLTIQI